ncbi:MAG: hypothetical protein ACI9D5_000087 [Candidatus Endobugula sp.]|jgi:hypothetical protein
MMKHLMIMSCLAVFTFAFSNTVLSKGSTLVDGSGKPVKVVEGCAKVTKSSKNDFHYSTCHKIKAKKTK